MNIILDEDYSLRATKMSQSELAEKVGYKDTAFLWIFGIFLNNFFIPVHFPS